MLKHVFNLYSIHNWLIKCVSFQAQTLFRYQNSEYRKTDEKKFQCLLLDIHQTLIELKIMNYSITNTHLCKAELVPNFLGKVYNYIA